MNELINFYLKNRYNAMNRNQCDISKLIKYLTIKYQCMHFTQVELHLNTSIHLSIHLLN